MKLKQNLSMYVMLWAYRNTRTPAPAVQFDHTPSKFTSNTKKYLA